jgi:hypothetical protein
MHCCARNIERLTRIPKLRTDLQSRFLSWLLLPFCQDLESFAHVLVAFFNICGCGKITDNLSEASKLVFSGSDFQEATWDLRLDQATRGNESFDISLGLITSVLYRSCSANQRQVARRRLGRSRSDRAV